MLQAWIPAFAGMTRDHRSRGVGGMPMLQSNPPFCFPPGTGGKVNVTPLMFPPTIRQRADK